MKLHSIQSLRAVAALLVVIYHVRGIEMDGFLRAGLEDTPLLSTLIRNGFAGVDLFFVISGFIMVYVTGQVKPRAMTSLAFLFARAARIYPLWWLFAGLATLYFFVTYGVPYDIDRTTGGSALLANNPWLHLVWSYTLMPQHSVPVFGLGWTLVHEMHFYVVFAVLILFPRRFLPWLLALWGGAVIAGSLSGLSSPYPADYVQLFFSPLSVEFIAGCFAAMLVNSGRRFLPWLLLVAGALWLIVALLIQGDVTMFTLGWGRVLMFGPPCVLIVYAFAAWEASSELRIPKWLVTLGDWSFSLYLCHTFVLSGLRRIFGFIAGQLQGTPYAEWFILGGPSRIDNILFYGLGISLSIVLSWLTFRFFEKPVMRITSKWRKDLFEDTNAQLRPAPIKAAIW